MLRRALLAVTVLGGCAVTSGATIDESRTGRLPEGDRRHIVAAGDNVEVAKANRSAAEVARDEAKQFQKIAGRELDAAKSRAEVARDAEYDVANRALIAARAKKDYADRLMDLREAQLEEQEATVEAARADREWAKYEALDRNGMAESLDRIDFERARENAQQKLGERRMRVAGLQTVVASLRTAWSQRRRDFNLAAREVPPPPPAALTPPPRLDVNEGPSGPESAPVDKPYQKEP